jgi:hypothetical protein
MADHQKNPVVLAFLKALGYSSGTLYGKKKFISWGKLV